MQKFIQFPGKVPGRLLAPERLRIHVYLALALTIFLLALLAFLSDAGYAHADEIQNTIPAGKIYMPFLGKPAQPAQPGVFDVSGLSFPNGVAVHRVQDLLFVVSRNTDQLYKLDGKTHELLGVAATGDQPWGIGVDPERNRVYVSNFGGGLWVYDSGSLARLAQIDVGTGPGPLAVNPTTDTVAVIVTGEEKIAFVEGLSLKGKISAAGSAPFGIAADIRTNQFVVSHRNSGTVGVYHRTDAGWRNDGALIHLGDRVVPFAVAMNHRTGRFYVQAWHPDGNWYLHVFQKVTKGDVQTGAVVQVGNSGHKDDADVGGAGLAVNVNNNRVFAVNTRDGSLSIFDGNTDRISQTAAIGADPTVLALNRDTGVVFVGLRNSSQLFRFVEQ